MPRKPQHPNSLANLIPNSQRTPEELKQMRRNGALKANAHRRETRTMRELLEHCMALPMLDAKGRPLLDPNTGQPLNGKEAQAVVLSRKAASGDLRAIRLIAQLLGELEAQPVLEGDILIDVSES